MTNPMIRDRSGPVPHIQAEYLRSGCLRLWGRTGIRDATLRFADGDPRPSGQHLGSRGPRELDRRRFGDQPPEESALQGGKLLPGGIRTVELGGFSRQELMFDRSRLASDIDLVGWRRSSGPG